MIEMWVSTGWGEGFGNVTLISDDDENMDSGRLGQGMVGLRLDKGKVGSWYNWAKKRFEYEFRKIGPSEGWYLGRLGQGKVGI